MNIKNTRPEIIYITYDGVMEPIGESQVISYLEGITNFYKINLISFEKDSDLKNKIKLENFNFRLKNYDILWSKKKYHKFPKIISTIYNILIGLIVTSYFVIIKKIKLIHIRSYISGLMVFFLKNFFDFKLIFDIRGFLPEEKVDRMGWNKNDIKYLFFKKLEKKLINDSDAIVCLTYQSVDILRTLFPTIPLNKFVVIPTCVDVNKFKNLKTNFIKNQEAEIVFGYIGTIDKAYDIHMVINLFSKFLKYNNKIIIKIFCKDSNDYLDKIFKSNNILKKNYTIQYVERNFLPNELNEIDVGIFNLKENYSIKASFPTRIAEYLSCGIPILCNDFNQDITDLIQFNKVGLIIDFNNRDYHKTYMDIYKLLSDKKINIRCRKLAERQLSLQKGVQSYLQLYNKLLV